MKYNSLQIQLFKILPNKKFRRRAHTFFFPLPEIPSKVEVPSQLHFCSLEPSFLSSISYFSPVVCFLHVAFQRVQKRLDGKLFSHRITRSKHALCRMFAQAEALSPCAPVTGHVSFALPLVRRIQIRTSINVQIKRLKTHRTQTYTNNYPFRGEIHCYCILLN